MSRHLATESDPLIPAGHEPLSRTVADWLAQRIITGESAPGERLTEPRLAELAGVSRSPVREALRILAGEGLVEITPAPWRAGHARRGARRPGAVRLPAAARAALRVRGRGGDHAGRRGRARRHPRGDGGGGGRRAGRSCARTWRTSARCAQHCPNALLREFVELTWSQRRSATGACSPGWTATARARSPATRRCTRRCGRATPRRASAADHALLERARNVLVSTLEAAVSYVVVGAGAIGGTVGARLARAGHDVLFCDADPAHVAAINEAGLTIEGPVEQFTVAARAVAPDELPDGLGAVLLAVKHQHTAAALGGDRAAAGAGRVRRLAAERDQRAADRRGRRRGAHGRRVRQLRRGLPGAGRIHYAGRGAFVVGELDGRRSRRASGALAARPRRGGHRQHHRLPVGQGGLRGDAVRHRRLRPVDRRRAGRAALPALFLGSPARCWPRRRAAPEPFDGFDADDLEGSIDRLVEFNRRSAKTHSGSTATSPCASGRPRSAARRARRAAGRPDARADRRDRGGPARVRGRQPRAAGRARADARAAPALNAVITAAAAAPSAPPPGRCTASRSRSRTTSTCAAS